MDSGALSGASGEGEGTGRAGTELRGGLARPYRGSGVRLTGREGCGAVGVSGKWVTVPAQHRDLRAGGHAAPADGRQPWWPRLVPGRQALRVYHAAVHAARGGTTLTGVLEEELSW